MSDMLCHRGPWAHDFIVLKHENAEARKWVLLKKTHQVKSVGHMNVHTEQPTHKLEVEENTVKQLPGTHREMALEVL